MSALQSSGAITLAQIQTEFGGSNPISMSEYYRGGSYVPSHSGTTGIPSSGQISMSQFYGKQDESPVPSTWSATIGVGNNVLFGSTAYGYSTNVFAFGTITDTTPHVGTSINGVNSLTNGTVLTYCAWYYDSKFNTAGFEILIQGKALAQSAFSRVTFGSFVNYYTSNATTFTSAQYGGGYQNRWLWSLTYSSNYSPKSGNQVVTLYQ